MTVLHRFKPVRPWRVSIRLQVLMLVGALVALMLVLQGTYMNARRAEIISEQIGLRALGVARTVAVIPELIDAFTAPEPALLIQPIAERIRMETGAEYVVVGNHEGIRYAHPVEERLGQAMVGGDNDRALIHGESYVSEATGTLGEAIRGKAPVFNRDGDIIGIVSVGFLIDDVEIDVRRYMELSWLPILLAVLGGLMGALWIARHFKQVILGLEPYEIARLVMEKEAILQSIHEGILAINKEGKVTLLNQAARRLMGVAAHEDLLNKPVQEVVPNSRLLEVLNAGEHQYDQETWIGDHPMVVNRVPIIHGGQLEGAVATFRSQREIMELSKALNEASADVDSLRVQAHEFSNRLYTVSGLLQLGRPDEALALIQQESRVAQEQVGFLVEHVSDAVISGMLLGKMLRAEQRGIQFSMPDSCSLHVELSSAGQEALMTVLSNLLDNAFDAVLMQTKAQTDSVPHVRLFFTDLGHQLVFEVEDSGPGIDPAQLETLLQQGFTTKPGKHRGIGLAQVQRLCGQFGGELTMEDGDLGGACFIVTVNKGRVAQQEISRV